LKLEAGFRPLGQGYRKPSVHRQGPLCMLSGVIRAADMKGGYTRIAVLPFLCRPSLGHLVFATNRGKMTQRIDVRIIWFFLSLFLLVFLLFLVLATLDHDEW
jgi:hypothetical protein